MSLTNKHIVLGVSGGIAAYKAAELTRLLIKQQATVQVVMSEAATHFVAPLTFQALSGLPVFYDQWDVRVANAMPHIDLTRQADALLIAPASADLLAKIALGLADDLLSTLTLARTCPLLLAPAMNTQMWENPATQRNIKTLKADGLKFLGPTSGEQACGESGLGRMLAPEAILTDLLAYFCPIKQVLRGKKVLLTAGPTFEAIDPVRGITNLSSGKMGFALAHAAQAAGAEVTLICGPVTQVTPPNVTRIDVVSALQMHAAVMQQIVDQDIFIGVAAVADYRPQASAAHKIKKNGQAAPLIELVQNPDILADVAALPNPPLCVGFAAESQNLAEYAQKKRQAKNIPLIVGNLVQHGIGGDHNTISLFDAQGETALPSSSKTELAQKIITALAQHLPH